MATENSLTLPSAVREIRTRHEQAKQDIQNNFGAAYSTRITQDSFSIHQDRATLIAYIDTLEKPQMDTAHHVGKQCSSGDGTGVGFTSLTSVAPVPALDDVAEALWRADALDGKRAEPWADVSEDWKEQKWRKLARAAIGALRTPSPAAAAWSWPEEWHNAIADVRGFAPVQSTSAILAALSRVGALRPPSTHLTEDEMHWIANFRRVYLPEAERILDVCERLSVQHELAAACLRFVTIVDRLAAIGEGSLNV